MSQEPEEKGLLPPADAYRQPWLSRPRETVEPQGPEAAELAHTQTMPIIAPLAAWARLPDPPAPELPERVRRLTLSASHVGGAAAVAQRLDPQADGQLRRFVSNPLLEPAPDTPRTRRAPNNTASAQTAFYAPHLPRRPTRGEGLMESVLRLDGALGERAIAKEFEESAVDFDDEHSL